MLNIFYFLLAALLLFSFGSILFWTMQNQISPTPTSPKAKKAILQLLNSNVPKNLSSDVLELGSGFLTLALPVAKLFPKNRIIAYETSTVPFIFSKIVTFFLPQKNLTILKENFFDIDLNQSSLIVCYLYPGAMEKLKIKFEQELKDNTFIISNTFAIPGWKPIKQLTINDLYKTNIYLYQFKAGLSPLNHS